MQIKIIPFGKIEGSVIEYLSNNLSNVFDAQVLPGEVQTIPEYASDKKRNQYHSTAILKRISVPRQNRDEKILGIIDNDLYAHQLNFVFGEADPQNGVCIISITRLRQSYYDLGEDKSLFLERALKEAVHETGHLLSLGHCPNAKCVMHFSNSLRDTDIKDYNFCEYCRKFLP